MSNIRVFGCPAFVHNKTHKGKLEARSEKGRFIGYDKASNSYLVLMEDGRVKLSHNVRSDESLRNGSTSKKADISVIDPTSGYAMPGEIIHISLNDQVPASTEVFDIARDGPAPTDDGINANGNILESDQENPDITDSGD